MNKSIDEITCAKCGTRNPDCVYTKVEEVIRGSVPDNNPYYQANKDAPRQNPLNKYIKCIRHTNIHNMMLIPTFTGVIVLGSAH